MTTPTIYWYDFETFGDDPRRDRAAQFAGLRTDEALNIVGEPLVLYCSPADDFLPSPQACLVTGITPQEALEKGIPEAHFIARIEQEFSRPETCVAGYNNIRFDDELTRQLLYRNFFSPYEREWKNGNSRWDIIDMLRLCAAVRPEGIKWPLRETGAVSFRLEDLTAANGVKHADAHDALSDVLATIEMARRVKAAQPRLYEYAYQLRRKQAVEARLDLKQNTPVVHVSSMYAAEHGRLALVAPLMRHPHHSNEIVIYDLRVDPGGWLDESPESIRRRIFAPNTELAPGEERIPLRTLHVNRCPAIAPASVLDAEHAARLQIDFARCQTHLEVLRSSRDLPTRLKQVFTSEREVSELDPDFMIYSGGFFSDSDLKLMNVVRESTPEQLAKLLLPFRDRRLPQMLFRYRARNFPASLDDEERQRWAAFKSNRFDVEGGRKAFEAALEEAAESRDDDEAIRVLGALRSYAEQILTST